MERISKLLLLLYLGSKLLSPLVINVEKKMNIDRFYSLVHDGPSCALSAPVEDKVTLLVQESRAQLGECQRRR
jgi:hypothetical protein